MLPVVLLLTLVLEMGEPPPSPPTPGQPPPAPAAALALDALPPSLRELGPAGSGSAPSPAPVTLPPALVALATAMALLVARPRHIAGARKDIRAALQDNLFSDVGHQELVSIARTIESLEPAAASAVVGSLTDGEIGVWMRELDGWHGGFSAGERARLFSDLAGRLQPTQLARLITEGRHARELTAAAARHAPGPARARLAMLLWAGRTPADPGWGSIIDLAVAAPPSELEAAAAAGGLSVLVDGLLGAHAVEGGGAVRFDALVAFLTLAGRFEDPALKADLFVTVARALASHRHSRRAGAATREQALGRLAGLIRSDPGSVITRLNHAADPHGNVLSSWIEDMIEADRIDELDVLLAALLGGGDRLATFAEPGSDPAHPFPNAANLGYYVGAYSLAIDAMADDAAGRIDLVGRLFSLVTGLVPGPEGSQIRLPLGPLVDVHAASVIAGLREQATGLRQALWDLAKPRTADGLLWNGPGTTQFQESWEEVVLVR